jgi:prepilin-type N-terminal cleavage/methylation domain-containing protein
MSAVARAGFTLIEVLAAMLLTAVVLGVALDVYVDVSRQSARAQNHTREIRRATAILDRLAREFESVVLVKRPPETADPLDHPWLFLGESERGGAGADHLKFVIRGHEPRASAVHESDLAVVAYALRPARDDDTLELVRWSSPRLPETLDRRIPEDESDGARLLADGLADFGVTFVDEQGGRRSSWDSSLLVESGELPVAVEIEVAFADPDADFGAEPRRYQRRALLRVRPIDTAELFDPTSRVSGGSSAEEEEEEEETEEDEEDEDVAANADPSCLAGPCGSMTVCQAIDCARGYGAGGTEGSLNMLLDQNRKRSFCAFKPRMPASLKRFILNPACR